MMKKKVSKKKVPTIRAPKGFYFKISCHKSKSINGYCFVNVDLFPNDQKLKTVKWPIKAGGVQLNSSDGGKYYKTHSYLQEQYHGRGIGAIIYARAIQWALTNKKKISSSGNSSEKALRVWKGKTLRRLFTLRKVPNRSDPSEQEKYFCYAKK